jgi:arylsulfatase A-like enzyme
MALWFGLTAGLMELVLIFLRKQLVDTATFGALQLNRHAIWMIPSSGLMILGSLGLIGSAGRRLGFKWARLITVYGLCFVSTLTLVMTFRGLTTIIYSLLAAGIAAQLTPLILIHAARCERIVRLSLPGLAAVLAGFAGIEIGREIVGEQRAIATLPDAKAGAPNVLFIVLDTVRARSLSLHGYNRDTSPFLRRLAEKGVRFDGARTTASWTLPSHASMFTGRWPHELSTQIDRPLDASFPTLAEYLRDHGYVTADFVASTYFCNQWYGLGRGFLHYEDNSMTPVEVLRSSNLGRRLVKGVGALPRNRPNAHFERKDAPTINEETLAWLDQRPKNRPFFAFLNYYDAHDPYLTPVEPAHAFGLRPTSRADVATLQNWHLGDKGRCTPREFMLARDCYDDCVAYLDRELGKLFDELQGRGLLANTVVIITSDHGEEFGERGRFGHGQSLHHEVTHVPLLITSPARIPAARTVKTPVSLRDLPATIVDLLDLGEGSPFAGRSLARNWTDLSAPAETPLAEIVDRNSHAPEDSKPVRSIIVDGTLYIANRDGREELYDLTDDPAEKNDLAGSATAQPRLERCRSALDRLVPGAAARR